MARALTFPALQNDRAQLSWLTWAECLRVDATVAHRAWRCIERSQHPTAQLFKYELASLLKCDPALRRSRIWRLHQPHASLSPTAVVALMDNFVTAGWLRRDDANHLTDAVLRWTDRSGAWAWVPKTGGML